jgi:hypothetical protein
MKDTSEKWDWQQHEGECWETSVPSPDRSEYTIVNTKHVQVTTRRYADTLRSHLVTSQQGRSPDLGYVDFRMTKH